MLTPGSPIHIEINGRSIRCRSLTRRQHREVLGLMRSVSALDTAGDKLAMMENFFDVVDRVVELCCPQESETVKDSIGPVEAMEMAGKLVAAHFGGNELKKKSESQPSSAAASSAAHAPPGAKMPTFSWDAQHVARADETERASAQRATASDQHRYPDAHTDMSGRNYPTQ